MSIKHTPSNEAQELSYLESTLGFSAAGAAGALGNFQQESGFSPTALQASSGATGIAQWQDGRLSNLESYAASRGLATTSLAAQLGYLTQELRGPYSSVLKAMQTATDPAVAADVWNRQFEISADTSNDRELNAQNIYNEINKGGWAAATANTGAGFLDTLKTAVGLAASDGPSVAYNAAKDGVEDVLGFSGWKGFALKAGAGLAGAVLIVLGLYLAAKPNPDVALSMPGAAAPLAALA